MLQTARIHDPFCQMISLQARSSRIMVRGKFSFNTLNPLQLTLISIDHVHSFMAIIFRYGDGHTQQGKMDFALLDRL